MSPVPAFGSRGGAGHSRFKGKEGLAQGRRGAGTAKKDGIAQRRRGRRDCKIKDESSGATREMLLYL